MKEYHNSPCFVDNCGAHAAPLSHRRRGPGPDARRPAEPPASRGLDGPRDRYRPSQAVPRRPSSPLRRRRACHADRHGCRGGGRRRRRGARGAAGAAAYRAVNTADAMLGYRDGALEWFGKLAARLDDVLNFVPARLAALGLLAGAAVAGEDARGALRMLRRDGALTASPNAGRTM